MEKDNDEADLDHCEKAWKAAEAWYKCTSISVHEKSLVQKAKIKKVPVPTPSDNDSNKENAYEAKETVCDDTQTVWNEKDVDLLKKTHEEEDDETRVNGYCTFCDKTTRACGWRRNRI
jgi:hypothetical protein